MFYFIIKLLRYILMKHLKKYKDNKISQTTIMQYPRVHIIVVPPINSIKHICCIACSTNCKKLKYIDDIKSAFLLFKNNCIKNYFSCVEDKSNLLRN